jgi:RNA polymerase sigma-70 factor (ECF subfamily)
MKKTRLEKRSDDDSKLRSPIPPEILDGILQGDEAAFAEYYAGVRGSLIAYLTRIVGDRDEAVNLAHDALVKLWEEREQIKRLTGGFVYTIASRDSIDLLRRRDIHKRYVKEQMFVQDDESPSADQHSMYEELARQYETIISNMPPQRRKVFEMSRHDGMTFKEIAENLDISQTTVKEHIQKAMKDLMRSANGVVIFFLLI